MRKLFAPVVVAAATLVCSANVSAEVVKINAGITLNPFFLSLTCNKLAAERGGRVVKSERVGPNKMGVCHIDVPRRSGGIVATPGAVVRQPIEVIQPVQPRPIKRPVGKLKMVGVGRLWSEAHAKDRCKVLAVSRGAEWTGNWTKHEYNGEEAKCELRLLPKPKFIMQEFGTGKIWNDGHAGYVCPRVAKNNKGSWTGKWKVDPSNRNKSLCMVKLETLPEVVKRFRTARIWNDAHAKRECGKLARENQGRWTGQWRKTRNGKGSVCMIKVAEAPGGNNEPTQQSQQQAPVAQSANVRNVAAGEIWDQNHAERKCPVVARNAKGSWTNRWTKTGPGNKSVCEVKFGGGIVAQPTKPTQQAPAPANNTRTRNVAAGPIWDDKQAAKKCPIVAADNKAKWTGNWTKTGPGHTSVCEISVVVAGTAPQTQQQPQQQQQPTQTRPASTVKEIAVGGVWDQTQANRKCQLAAINNKGRWTGGWRKIDARNNAVCSIDLGS